MEDLRKLKEMREQVFADMRATRKDKYKGLIRGIRVFKYLMLLQTRFDFPEAFRRGEFLSTYYALMHHIDDVVDDDVPLPTSAQSKKEYVEQRIAFISQSQPPTDIADYLFLYSSYLADQLGYDMHSETEDIFRSLLWDAHRTGTSKVFPERELNHHFYLLDIRGTIRGMLRLFDETPEKFEQLEYIGRASRIYFNLKDLVSDIKAGVINISQEDCHRHNISPADLEVIASNGNLPLSYGIRKWVREQANEGLDLLAYHRLEILPKHSLGLWGRLTLRFVYEQPAKQYFMKALNTSNNVSY